MNKSIFLFLALGLLYVSCKKEADLNPSPALYLQFGHRTGGIMSSGMSTVIKIESYSNQDSIYLVQLNKELVLQIREENVPHDKLKTKASIDLSFALPVRTAADSEVFVSSRNVQVQGARISSDPDRGTYTIGQDFIIPVHITAQAIPNNNILEISPTGDIVECSLSSDYTGTKARESLKINKE